MIRALIVALILLSSLSFNYLKGQTKITKTLYFFQDSVFYIGCGGETHASLLLFVSDLRASKMISNQYHIVVECLELYGSGYFRKGARYKLMLSKDYKKMSSYFSKGIFSTFRKKKNLYISEKIDHL